MKTGLYAATDILKRILDIVDEIEGRQEDAHDEAEGGHWNIINRAKAYIEDFYMEELTLQRIADEVGISAGYLFLIFSCRHSHYLFKHPGKVFFILITNRMSDLIRLKVILLQITAGPPDSDLIEIIRLHAETHPFHGYFKTDS